MLDSFGPFIVFCKPRMALTREANRTRRDTIKLYVLLSVLTSCLCGCHGLYEHRQPHVCPEGHNDGAWLSNLTLVI